MYKVRRFSAAHPTRFVESERDLSRRFPFPIPDRFTLPIYHSLNRVSVLLPQYELQLQRWRPFWISIMVSHSFRLFNLLAHTNGVKIDEKPLS